MNRFQWPARGVVLAAVVWALAGCATEVPPTFGPLHTNDLLKYLPPDHLAWALSTKSRLRESMVPERLQGRVLGLIAYQASHAARPCRNLAIVSISALAAEPFSVQGPAPAPVRTYRPDTLLERWAVSTCGQVVQWLVFDDRDNLGAELTLLRGTAPAP